MLPPRKLPTLLAILAIALAGTAGGIWWFTSQKNSQQAAVEQTQQVDQLQVTLRVDQSAVGTRIVEVETHGAGTTASAVAQVRLRFSMAEMDMGKTEVAADPVGQGRFQARGSFFSMVGEWNVDALLSHADGTETSAHFAIPIAAPGESAGPLNPLASNTETIAAGQLLYRANCATCHGDSGRGDGPAGKGLNPRPIDFTQHMAVGKHTDGQVFLWVSNGVPGSAMPAFKQRLNEQEIWQLVTYLRTFAAPTAPSPETAQPAAADPVITSVDPTSTPIRRAPIAESKEPLPPLVFARQGQIWTSDGAGNSKRIANFGDEGYAQYPALSPDGSQVAFVLVRQAPITAEVPLPTASLYLANLDGSNQREVWKPNNLMLSLPSWTADGKAIYLAANDSTGSEQSPLSVARFELAAVKATTILTDALDPTVSRDGGKLAFLKLSDDGYTMSLHTAALDGGGDQELLDGTAFQGLYAPRFSPDGSKIVFAAIGGPETNTKGEPLSGNPLGALLAWLEPPRAEAHGLPWDLWQINADGTGLVRLTTINEDLPMATFSPDGKQIAFMGFNGFYLMNADGGNLRRLNAAGDHGGIEWRR